MAVRDRDGRGEWRCVTIEGQQKGDLCGDGTVCIYTGAAIT